jgi:hypothetical protein
MATKRKISEGYSVEAAALEYVGENIWMKAIEDQHCQRLVHIAEVLVAHSKTATNRFNMLACVTDFEHQAHEQELTRRRQVRALQYLVHTAIL